MTSERKSQRLRRRRGALAALGMTGAAWLAGRAFAQSAQGAGASPSCVLTQAQTEGPYFVDERLERSDIRSDPTEGAVKPGALLTLQLRVSTVGAGSCAPLAGAIVDVWHCDAAGVYSDVASMGRGPRGSRFLRGYQVTDAKGRVTFTTIYPGAYPGRAVHVHFKIRSATSNGVREFTSQFYFDDALTDRVHARPPYPDTRERTRNDRDGLYRAGGRSLQLDVRSTGEGYATAYDVGIAAA